MNILVKDRSSHYILDGGLWECQHEVTETVPVDFGAFNPREEDYIDNWQDAEVCVECNKVLE